MFSLEYNGYKKDEVDKFISDLKASYEKSLMEEKLKVLEAEKKVLDYKKKQKNFVSVFESLKKQEAEGSRNLEILRGEQLRMVYLSLLDFLNELNARYPGVLLSKSYKKIITDIETILDKTEARKNEVLPESVSDPMRVLLTRIQDKKMQESPKEVRIERAQFDRHKNIKPVCEEELSQGGENENYDSLVDKFLNTKPVEEEPKSLKIQSSGFDLKEAVNPKDDLSEIMKAFDFYSDVNNKANREDYHFDD